MNQTRAQAKLLKNFEPQLSLTDELPYSESRDMASKFVAQHNLALAHECWAELNRWDLNAKQDGDIPASLNEPN